MLESATDRPRQASLYLDLVGRSSAVGGGSGCTQQHKQQHLSISQLYAAKATAFASSGSQRSARSKVWSQSYPGWGRSGDDVFVESRSLRSSLLRVDHNQSTSSNGASRNISSNIEHAKTFDDDTVAQTLQTNEQATANLLNTCLDSAVLTVGFGLDRCGLLVGFGVMLLSAWLNARSVLLNLECCRLTNSPESSPAFARRALGRAGEAVFLFFNAAFPFLQQVSYVFAVRDALLAVTPLSTGLFCNDIALKTLICVVLFAPPTYRRSLPDLGLMSRVAFAACVCCVSCIAVLSCLRMMPAILSEDHHFWEVDPSAIDRKVLSSPTRRGGIRMLPDSVVDVCLGGPVLALLFCGEFGAQVVLATLKDPNPKNQQRVCRNAYVYLFVVYFVAGFFSALQAQLNGTRVDGNVLSSLAPPASGAASPGGGPHPVSQGGSVSSLQSTLYLFAQLSAIVLMVLSYFIEGLPLRFLAFEVFLEQDEAVMEGSRNAFLIITTLANAAVSCVALSLSSLQQAISLNAAISVSVVGFALPPLIWGKLAPERFGVVDGVSVICGVVLSVVGVAAALVGDAEES